MANLKPSLNIYEQIKLLKGKGLIIPDHNQAEEFLLENNYYRLNIYFHKLMDRKDHFQSGTSFTHIIGLYQKDSFLRQQIFSVLEPIEINIKTKIAYVLGIKYGPEAFYYINIFRNEEFYRQLRTQFNMEITKNIYDPVISHHREHYSDRFPIWVIVEYLSFNSISKLIANLNSVDQKTIARSYFGVDAYYFRIWVHALSVMRNICAHYGYLYRREFPVPISLGRDTEVFPSQERTLFSIFYSLKKLSKPDQWELFRKKIFERFSEDQFATDYLFPNNWRSLVFDT